MEEDRTVNETQIIRVRYWAAARSAAGVAEDELRVHGPMTVADVRRRVILEHPDSDLDRVLQACSTLIGDQPLGAADPERVVVPAGSTVEFLPPFAGG